MDYTLTVNEEEIKLLSTALGQLPYNVVAALMIKLAGQVADQEKKEDE